MLGYTAPSKAAIRRAINASNNGEVNAESKFLDFWRNVQETSLFGAESKVPGDNTVVGPDAYTDRRWYGTLTVNADGKVTAVK